MKTTRGSARLKGIGFILLALAAVAMPYLLEDADQTLYSQIGLAAIVTIGVTLLIGFAGQISLGQGALYALGAYVTGILAVRGVSPLLALLAAPPATALIAAIVGAPLLRMRGHYLAFATFALHLIVLSLLFSLDGLTGGQIGLTGIPQLEVFGFTVSHTLLGSLIWLTVIVTLIITRNLVNSRAGRGLQAIAGDEETADAAGIHVSRDKLKVFILAGALAGFAGGLYAYLFEYLSPDSFPILLSVELLLMAAIGGLGSLGGAVFGAATVTLLSHYLGDFATTEGLPAVAPQIATLAVFGMILVVVMLYFPQGLLPAITRRLSSRRNT